MRRRAHLRLLCFALCLCAPVAAAQELLLPAQSSGGLLFVEATVNGRARLLLVDTGSDITILHDHTRSNPRGHFGTYRFTTVDARVALGQLPAIDLRVALADLSALRRLHRAALGRDFDGILGMDVLRRFARITVDFDAGALRLQSKTKEAVPQ